MFIDYRFWVMGIAIFASLVALHAYQRGEPIWMFMGAVAIWEIFIASIGGDENGREDRKSRLSSTNERTSVSKRTA
jgi:hypothetical protein